MGISNSVLPKIKNDSLRHRGRDRRHRAPRGLTPLETPEVRIPSMFGVLATAVASSPLVYVGVRLIMYSFHPALPGVGIVANIAFGLAMITLGVGLPWAKLKKRQLIVAALREEDETLAAPQPLLEA